VRETLTPIPLADIEAAQARLQGIALRTPLVPLGIPDASPQILLKLENLQPIGSFKLRGAANAMAVAGTAALTNGVYTASAGNMAQGLAWGARQIGVRCRVVVPETAPQTKIAAIERLGGEVIKVPFELWERFAANHPHDEPHAYLSLLATHPDHRGQGIGQRLLAEDLARWDAARLPAYLESTNPGNDHRYERAGFRRIGGFRAVLDDAPISTMWRPPQASTRVERQ
jgi:threonine dehydratase